ncbi:MAG: MBOAT family protein [Flavobacteriales bacterium]|nr:Peptidoglycan O-acetyltransferase [Flavobacteriales bacterium]MCC6576444.1 MBOAT family protein [Flavobacteriales bacterium]NUQ16062.1 MBOAT family protein [Flavobacteriales bacterium]
MLFNSFTFALFLPVVFALYWGVCRTVTARNLLLIVAGCVFYGWWDWRFLLLLAATSMTDYGVAIAMDRVADPRRRKAWLWVSLVGNLGTLGIFKYHDFFATSLADALARAGIATQPVLLHVVLPVGISFYTFQALSYTIDVYRRRIAPVRDLPSYLAFISFFPQLCAGPIERASHMLPQFARPRRFEPDQATDGLRQMLWGLFKKVVVADNCATLVDRIFGDSAHLPGPLLVLGAVLFALQIYGDFSGYSDIAIGCARLFGFELMRNFAYPYFSRDIAEFWRRWHISLSTWFRDYVYIPLGGSRGGTWMSVRNTFAIFLLSGFWHGANWTFLAWGFLNALYFLPLLLGGRNRTHLGTVAPGRWLPSTGDALRITTTFALTCLAWVFFRAEDLDHAFAYLARMGDGWLRPGAWQRCAAVLGEHLLLAPAMVCAVALFVVEWVQREHAHGLERLPAQRPLRWAIYLAVLAAVVFVGDHGEQQFIYFQF